MTRDCPIRRREAFTINSAQPRWKQVFFSNPWRVAFLVLLVLVLLAVIAALSFWLSISRPQTSADVAPQRSAVQDSGVPIEANISQAALNQYVDFQLAKKETPVRDAELSFEEKKVRLDTSLSFFGRMMDMTVWMRPEVQPNGDLRLVSEEARIGRLSIPQKTLFAVLEGLPWPPWIHTRSEQKTIDLRLSERQNEQGMTYKIDRIDWDKKSVSLDILLPHK